MFLRAVKGSALYRRALEEKLRADVAYLAPEQVDCHSTFVDYLCDLYSLGVILYVLVTGRLPFQGESMDETCEQIRESAPFRPMRYQKSIPREFEWVIMRMLAKRQEDRYQSPEEFLADLRRIAAKYGLPD